MIAVGCSTLDPFALMIVQENIRMVLIHVSLTAVESSCMDNLVLIAARVERMTQEIRYASHVALSVPLVSARQQIVSLAT